MCGTAGWGDGETRDCSWAAIKRTLSLDMASALSASPCLTGHSSSLHPECVALPSSPRRGEEGSRDRRPTGKDTRPGAPEPLSGHLAGWPSKGQRHLG